MCILVVLSYINQGPLYHHCHPAGTLFSRSLARAVSPAKKAATKAHRVIRSFIGFIFSLLHIMIAGYNTSDAPPRMIRIPSYVYTPQSATT
jgi:hypothetical protein